MNQGFYEGIVQTAGIAASARRAQFDWRERIKELNCLYGIMQVAVRPGTS